MITDASFEGLSQQPPIVLSQDLLLAELSKKDQTIADQQAQLSAAQVHLRMIRAANDELRKSNLVHQSEVEQEQEYMANKLIRQIFMMKQEKVQLMDQVEKEEEYLTNNLQRKMSQLQKEKIELENALEQEQEFMMNRLQQQIEYAHLQPQSLAGSPRLRRLSTPASAEFLYPSALIDFLKRENNTIKMKSIEQDAKHRWEIEQILNQNHALKNEVFILKQSLNRETAPSIDVHLSETIESDSSAKTLNDEYTKTRPQRSQSLRLVGPRSQRHWQHQNWCPVRESSVAETSETSEADGGI